MGVWVGGQVAERLEEWAVTLDGLMRGSWMKFRCAEPLYGTCMCVLCFLRFCAALIVRVQYVREYILSMAAHWLTNLLNFVLLLLFHCSRC